MKVFIDYSDGQYYMGSCEPGGHYESRKPTAEIDVRDFERYQEFQRVIMGWNCFIRDVSEKVAIGPNWMLKESK